MTRDDIILMADASGLSFYGMNKDREKFIYYLEAFATLVAAAKPWQGLTDEDKKKIATVAGCTEDDDGHIVMEIFRLAEIKLKERNT